MARAVRNFNLENRAEREISRMKPSPAPRHPSTKNLLREQMSSECCRGASGPGARAPGGVEWWASVQWRGDRGQLRSPGSAELGKVEPPGW